MNPLLDVFERALTDYTSGPHYEILMDARNEYFLLTGQINEDDHDYEARMNSFNNWYVLDYLSPKLGGTIMEDFLKKNDCDAELKTSLRNPIHGLFEFKGENLRGCKVLRDLLHGGSFTFKRDTILPAILKNDIFTGRVMMYGGEPYLLSGICILPKEIKALMERECRKIAEYQDLRQEKSFLIKTEYLKTKWNRYGHLDANKIFSAEIN